MEFRVDQIVHIIETGEPVKILETRGYSYGTDYPVYYVQSQDNGDRFLIGEYEAK